MKFSISMNKTGTIAVLIILLFFSNKEVYADEIGPSTCGSRIMVRGDISHYTNEEGYTVANATDDDMYIEEVYGLDFAAVVEARGFLQAFIYWF